MDWRIAYDKIDTSINEAKTLTYCLRVSLQKLSPEVGKATLCARSQAL